MTSINRDPNQENYHHYAFMENTRERTLVPIPTGNIFQIFQEMGLAKAREFNFDGSDLSVIANWRKDDKAPVKFLASGGENPNLYSIELLNERGQVKERDPPDLGLGPVMDKMEKSIENAVRNERFQTIIMEPRVPKGSEGDSKETVENEVLHQVNNEKATWSYLDPLIVADRQAAGSIGRDRLPLPSFELDQDERALLIDYFSILLTGAYSDEKLSEKSKDILEKCKHKQTAEETIQVMKKVAIGFDKAQKLKETETLSLSDRDLNFLKYTFLNNILDAYRNQMIRPDEADLKKDIDAARKRALSNIPKEHHEAAKAKMEMIEKYISGWDVKEFEYWVPGLPLSVISRFCIDNDDLDLKEINDNIRRFVNVERQKVIGGKLVTENMFNVFQKALRGLNMSNIDDVLDLEQRVDRIKLEFIYDRNDLCPEELTDFSLKMLNFLTEYAQNDPNNTLANYETPEPPESWEVFRERLLRR